MKLMAAPFFLELTIDNKLDRDGFF
jgi:hypothetical protein